MKQAPHNLSQWVEHLSNEDLPILSNTVRIISDTASNPESSVADLSQVILPDTSMTTRVLRMANSAHYNFNSHTNSINTISRAIVVLGFDVIRSISLTIAMIDTLLQGEQQEKVLIEMARAFHTAVQAKAIAIENGDDLPEEVFIAALLHRIGHIIFGCFSYGMADLLSQEIANSPENIEAAERRVLGFPLKDLSLALNREWHLSSLMEEAMRGDKKNSRVIYIHLASSMVLAVEKGWENDETNHLLDKIGSFLGKKPDDIYHFITKNAQLARDIAMDFGAIAAGRLIPLPPSLDDRLKDKNENKNNTVNPDPQLQLRILHELSSMLTEKIDLNVIISTVLEGVFRGLTMDRAWFAITTADGNLTIRYVLGDGIKKFNNSVIAEVGNYNTNIFSEVIKSDHPRWVVNGRIESYKLSDQIADSLGEEFFLKPINLSKNATGLFYCDRHISGSAMDEESYQGFCQFCEHVSIALILMKK